MEQLVGKKKTERRTTWNHNIKQTIELKYALDIDMVSVGYSFFKAFTDDGTQNINLC